MHYLRLIHLLKHAGCNHLLIDPDSVKSAAGTWQTAENRKHHLLFITTEAVKAFLNSLPLALHTALD